jgi:hypothetical protein
MDMMIDTIFGADLTLFDGVRVQPRLADFDSRARLVNLSYQSKNYVISGQGASISC